MRKQKKKHTVLKVILLIVLILLLVAAGGAFWVYQKFSDTVGEIYQHCTFWPGFP